MGSVNEICNPAGAILLRVFLSDRVLGQVWNEFCAYFLSLGGW